MKNFLRQVLSDNQKVYDCDFVMIRVDKSIDVFSQQLPFARWDPNFYDTRWEEIISILHKNKIRVKPLCKYFPNDNWIISTDHVRASKGEKEGPQYPIEYYSPAGFTPTGYDVYGIPRCSENAYDRMKRGAVKKLDILLGGFGMGPTGKSVLLLHKPAHKSIVGNIFILRTGKQYDPFILQIFFKCKYGQAQFNRYKTGVAFYSLSNEEIKNILVPEIEITMRSAFRDQYLKMNSYHVKAMKAKSVNDKKAYIDNNKMADDLQTDLINKLELLIEKNQT